MEGVFGWVRQLGFLALFAGLVEIILPPSDVRKAVRLLVGLVIMVAVLEPLVTWVAAPDVHGIDALWDRLAHEVDPHLEAGEGLAAVGVDRAQSLWLQQSEKELNILVGLIEGAGRAQVQVIADERERFSPRRVVVHLGDAEVSADVVDRVQRLIVQVFPQLDLGAVDVSPAPRESADERVVHN